MGRPARGRRPVARAPDEDRAHARRTRAPSPTGRPPSSPTTRTGGTARRSTAATRRSRRRSGAASTASCGSTSGGLVPHDVEAHVDLTGRRRATSGSASRSCTRSSCASTTRSATTCTPRIPALSDDELFDKARLVVAALMAKIHTVDWTPAIIAHPTTVRGMRTNWWGLEGEWLGKRIGRRTSNEVIRGIPGTPTDHHGVPYSLTEEFVCRLPHAPADPGRVQLPLARRRHAHSRSGRFAELGVLHVRERFDEHVDERRALLVRHLASGRDHAAQLPALPPAFRHGRRDARRPRRRSTSCASASAACRATTSSAGCSTSSRTTRSRRWPTRPSTPRTCAGSTATSSRWTR